MTTRRSFFSVLAAVAATATLDPERALWVPGKRVISTPSPVRLATMAETMAAQREFMRPHLPSLMLQSSALWKRIADSGPISTRAQPASPFSLLLYTRHALCHNYHSRNGNHGPGVR